MAKDIIIGIDAGTSILKVVAFTLNGKEIASSSKKKYIPNFSWWSGYSIS